MPVELFYHPLASFCWSYLAMCPLGHFPALRDDGRVIVESSIIIEHLGGLIPATNALEVRARDRFFDLEIHMQMQKVVGDELRAAADKDLFGVAEARTKIRTAYAYLESWIGDAWACGETFTLADCAAAPALWYANKVAPMRGQFPRVAAYLSRLEARPSFARVLREAEPFMKYFPGKPDPAVETIR
jgi:glutathione S-transferase